MFFNKKIKRMEEKIKELESEIRKLRSNCRMYYNDPNAFFGGATVGVSDVLEDLIGKMGYQIIPSITKVELKKVKSKGGEIK